MIEMLHNDLNDFHDMEASKPRVIKDFEKLSQDLVERIKLTYPYGFSDELITFNGKDGKKISALPFETEEKYYMIKMSVSEADRIIQDDDDYDDDGILRSEVRLDYMDKHDDDDVEPIDEALSFDD